MLSMVRTTTKVGKKDLNKDIYVYLTFNKTKQKKLDFFFGIAIVRHALLFSANNKKRKQFDLKLLAKKAALTIHFLQYVPDTSFFILIPKMMNYTS